VTTAKMPAHRWQQHFCTITIVINVFGRSAIATMVDVVAHRAVAIIVKVVAHRAVAIVANIVVRRAVIVIISVVSPRSSKGTTSPTNRAKISPCVLFRG